MISLAVPQRGAEAAAAGSIRENMRRDVEPRAARRGRQQVHIPAHSIHTISSSRYSIFYFATQASLHLFNNKSDNNILKIKTITNYSNTLVTIFKYRYKRQ